MKIMMLKTKTTPETVVEVKDCYAARLIEQGKAVPVKTVVSKSKSLKVDVE